MVDAIIRKQTAVITDNGVLISLFAQFGYAAAIMGSGFSALNRQKRNRSHDLRTTHRWSIVCPV